MALQRQVAAPEGVEVVEADRERDSEALGDLCTEEARALEAHEQLEPDLDGLVVAEQEAALRRDQLVRPGEVGRVGLDPEAPAEPLPAPGAGEERRPGAEGSAGEVVKRPTEGVTGQRARPSGIGDLDVAVERRSERLLVPVENGPVDEEQALLRAGLARRLAQVAGGAALHGVEADALRDVGVPEQVVRNERAARAVDEHDAALRERRQLVEEVGERAGAEAAEDGIAGKLAVGRFAGAPRPTARSCRGCRASRRRARPRGAPRRPPTVPPPARPARPRAPREPPPRPRAARSRARPHPPTAGSAVQGRTSRRRSSVRDALQENSRLPSGSPVVGS